MLSAPGPDGRRRRPSPAAGPSPARRPRRPAPCPARSGRARSAARRATSCSAVPSPSTLPWPKIPNTPANSGTSVPSSSSRALRHHPAHQRLRGREPDGLGASVMPRSSSAVTRPAARGHGQRGSVACAAQVSRTQPWAGSSQNASARSCAGPAMHVEVVHRVARRRHARPVVAVRHQHDVVVADLERSRRAAASPAAVVLGPGVGAVVARSPSRPGSPGPARRSGSSRSPR